MTPTTNNVGPTTSATERLRALLDERGVEWQSPSGLASSFADSITFIGNVAVVSEIDGSDLLRINFDGTPEQAVAVTLGPGTCHIDLVGYDEREDRFQCRSCDWSMSVRRGTWPRFNYCPNCGRTNCGRKVVA